MYSKIICTCSLQSEKNNILEDLNFIRFLTPVSLFEYQNSGTSTFIKMNTLIKLVSDANHILL